MKKTFTLLSLTLTLLLTSLHPSNGQITKVLYLSGTGNDHTVNWDFFCTGGRNAGRWTSIPVPSNWELQGFGTYNYGLDKDSLRGKENGLYKYGFEVPQSWKGLSIYIVFEGSMTDTEVKINGKSAGQVHQGAFYRFSYDVTKLIKPGKKNLLEVTVSKESANKSVNMAERHGDYWIFGGIFRPVYLKGMPVQHIAGIALNAMASGDFTADISCRNIASNGQITGQIYTLDGKTTGNPFTVRLKKGDTLVSLRTHIDAPDLWSPEFPNLYSVVFTLSHDGLPVHQVTSRFGFRTVEFRNRDGIYINGTRILFKGICRHSFWPSSGRTLSRAINLEDASLIKQMNMNAVRMSHYPPDDGFLDICDSLGLFVLDELAGWHHAYDTQVGTKLVQEMVSRDVNHPSVVIWDNGNEGGHNFDLDPEFDLNDPQKRPVIHPWQLFRGINTEHYINYDYGNGTCFHGHDVFFPTEFLHGLYDGGLGAGLSDYWNAMWNNPLSAGGFLWVFSDEGVVRTDKNGMIDTDGDHAPDGIVGPYRQKEGSFFTVKEVWAPIFFEHREITPSFDGKFEIQNRYLYTNTDQCTFTWKLKKFPDPSEINAADSIGGTISAPSIRPGETGWLNVTIPNNRNIYNVLYITAFDPHGKEIYTWSWPVSKPTDMADRIVDKTTSSPLTIEENDTACFVKTSTISVTFNRRTGLLQKVQNSKGNIPFNQGPVLCEGEAGFKTLTCKNYNDSITVSSLFDKKGDFKKVEWTIYSSGWIKLAVQYAPPEYESDFLGISFTYPEKLVTGVKLLGKGPYRVWKNRMQGSTLDLWDKKYNNTITGERGWIYPEFKGYYANLYWVKFETKEQPFTVISNDEDIFLRLFTPDPPKKTYNVAPAFPTGNISFLQGIPPIGTKSQKAENMGPSGRKNMYFDYWKARPKAISLYFDFRATN